jgi:hypothetical protein
MVMSVPTDGRKGRVAERRASPRFDTRHQVRWRSLIDSGSPPCIADVRDISADGIGLVLQSWVAPGSMLAVTLLDANGDAGIFNLVRVKRIRLAKRTNWLVGGTFVQKVCAADLDPLLG